MIIGNLRPRGLIARLCFTLFPLFLLTGCSGIHQDSYYTLTVVHMNDTHSHLEPVTVNLTVNGVETTARLGGFARIKTALDEMRTNYPHLVLLHGGDAVQGSLYFHLFARLAPYAKQVAQYRAIIVGNATTPLVRGLNSGPGPLACDAILAAIPEANAALG